MAHDPAQLAYLMGSNGNKQEQDQALIELPITPLFRLGEVVGTPGALKAMRAANISLLLLLRRHLTGDWGDLNNYDK